MGRRGDIDWESIEKDVRAGQLSWEAIAKAHGVSSSQVRAKARENGWERDLSAAIDARTQAKLAQIDVEELVEQSARESAEQSAGVIRQAVEQAADTKAGILLRHRASIRSQHERAARLEALFDGQLNEATGDANLVALAQVFRTLVETRGKLINQERQAFGFDKNDEGKQQQPAYVSIQF